MTTPLSSGSLPSTAGVAQAQAGLVLGIIGAVLSLIPVAGVVLGVVLGMLAAIFSGVALSELSWESPQRRQAIIGLVLGLVTVAFKLIPGTRHL